MLTMAAEYWPLLLVALLIGIAAGWWAWSRRGRRVTFTPADDATPRATLARAVPAEPVIAGPEAIAAPLALAIPSAGGEADDLHQMKGVGPKLVGHLNSLGIVRFEQIAGWDDTAIAEVDEQLGAFRGRIGRDRWVEQARFLAAGDVAGFERAFGKLNGGGA